MQQVCRTLPSPGAKLGTKRYILTSIKLVT